MVKEALYCALYLIAISVIIFLLGRVFPKKWVKPKSFPFKSFAFEKEGKIYEKIGIRKWKTKWPDASLLLHKIMPKRLPKKRLDGDKKEKAVILLKESCLAESVHALAIIAGLFSLKICKNWLGILLNAIYTFINIPPILIQRYNRPRLQRLAA